MPNDRTQKEMDELVERAILVAADRVDSLVSRPNFHELSTTKALKCLTQCVKAAMLETDHISYNLITQLKRKRIFLNIKMFEATDSDYDVQLKYSIDDS
jgi:hypothetical protein